MFWLIKNLFVWRWSRWLLIHSKTFQAMQLQLVTLHKHLNGASWGWDGLCPFCGKDHHAQERAEMLAKLAAEREKLEATQKSGGAE